MTNRHQVFSVRRGHCLSAVLVATSLCLIPNSLAVAQLVTFYFEAELIQELGEDYSLPVGQRVIGNYTFELSTPPTTFGSTESFTAYNGAITEFNLTLVGFGSGHGSSGDILLGNPVRTSGSSNFLSDQYYLLSPATGITIPSSLGERHLLSANIRLADLDLVGLDSDALSPIPPPLAPFLDHTGPNFDSDNAELWLTFDVPWGGGNTAFFRLTSLTAVPEPATLLLLASLAPAAMFRRGSRR